MMRGPDHGHKGLVPHGEPGLHDLDRLPGQPVPNPVVDAHAGHLLLPGGQVDLLLDGKELLQVANVSDTLVHVTYR